MLPADELDKLDLDKLFEEDLKRGFYAFRNFAYNFFSRNIGLISLTTMPPLLYTTTIKRKEWEYEEEWRLSIYKREMGIPFSILYPGDIDYEGRDDRFFRYSKGTIQSISLGKHFLVDVIAKR